MHVWHFRVQSNEKNLQKHIAVSARSIFSGATSPMRPAVSKRVSGWYALALLHLRSGNPDLAVQELREIVKEVPTNRQAAELLSRIINGH
jgi:predicted Zn-dependent protease